MPYHFETFHLSPVSVSSQSYPVLEIYPTHDFRETLEVQAKEQRALTGKTYTFRQNAESMRYSVPLTWVTSADKNTIETWWRDQQELILTFNNSASDPALIAVKISNVRKPFGERQDVDFDRFQGFLEMRATRKNLKAEAQGPFILDHAYYGLLDQSYNVLI